MAKAQWRMPPLVTELLRLCMVALFTGLGFEAARYLGSRFEGLDLAQITVLGVVLGAAIGYVLGGAIGRLTVRSLETAETALTHRSSEQLLAGLLGGLAGAVLGVGLSWPLLFLRPVIIFAPVFAFVVIVMIAMGHLVGRSRRESLFSLLAGRAGVNINRPQALSALERVVDTSAAIDGRIVDVVRAGFLHGRMVVPQPVLDEIQGLADSGDDLKRARGRRALETLEALQRERFIDLEVIPDGAREVPEVDAKLVRTCLDRGAALLTLDTPLAKAAGLAGCRVMNLHALALAVRPQVIAGDTISVLALKPGKEPGQTVGYLDDGTMVVIERSRALVGHEVEVQVSSVLTNANGRMIFAKPLPQPIPPGQPAAPPSGKPGPPTPGKPGPRPGPHLTPRSPRESDAVSVLVGVIDTQTRRVLDGVRAGLALVPGGANRQQSVDAGLAALAPDVDRVLVHDAARCLTPPDVFARVLDALAGGATAVVPAVPVVDTLRARAGGVVDRSALVAVQTPQGFARDVLERAHRLGDPDATDDALLAERLGETVTIVDGDAEALKVTTPFDLLIADAVVRTRMT